MFYLNKISKTKFQKRVLNDPFKPGTQYTEERPQVIRTHGPVEHTPILSYQYCQCDLEDTGDLELS